ncbi:DUF4340 domain-containing protein [Pleionea sp. CnH1-48]|uniref:DUF4340 domain-containing protein n=1 Tax=Pleionea sp. CnH1-48 TaxID=2954494 RepID=UPI002096FBC1|nr:DUF4340 domain-containing protein [Pleionea sp. CnH1-48]MCO7226762.1 DUF4340 domain-containing protein [Pleionea sp. CnH1-48]
MLQSKQFSIGLILVVLITIAAISVQITSDSSTEFKPNQLLFPELGSVIEQVDEVFIRDDEITIQIERKDNAWGMPEKAMYPINYDKLKSIMSALKDAHLLETKTANRDKYHRLKVADIGQEGSGILLELRHQGKAVASLIVGDSSKGLSGQYVRKPGEAQSYLVDKSLDISAQKTDWLNVKILDYKQADIRSMERAEGAKQYILSRETATDTFTLSPQLKENEKLGEEYKLNGVVSVLSGFELKDVFASQNTVSPGSVVRSNVSVYETFDGLKIRLTYQKTNEDRHFVTVSTEANANAESAVKETSESLNKSLSPWVFEISAFNGDELARTRGDLVTVLSP